MMAAINLESLLFWVGTASIAASVVLFLITASNNRRKDIEDRLKRQDEWWLSLSPEDRKEMFIEEFNEFMYERFPEEKEDS